LNGRDGENKRVLEAKPLWEGGWEIKELLKRGVRLINNF
jgi:hypothetical protein